MNQKVSISFVIILAVAFAVLLFFYFQATVDRYTIRVQNEVQSELINVYDEILQNPESPPMSLSDFEKQYGDLEPIQENLATIRGFYEKQLTVPE